MKSYISLLIFCLAIISTPSVFAAKNKDNGPVGPYAQLGRAINRLNSEIERDKKAGRSTERLEKDLAELKAEAAEEHAKNKAKRLDSKLKRCQEKLDAGGDKEKINRMIAEIKEEFEKEYESFYRKLGNGGKGKKKNKKK